MQHDAHVRREFADPPPHEALARLDELLIHLRRYLRSRLHAEVIAEEDDIDVRTHRAEEALEVHQVQAHDPVEEGVRPVRVFREQHQEAVVAVQELPHLEQVAAKEADDRAVRLAPQARGAGGQGLQPLGTRGDRTRRRGGRHPHDIVQGLRKAL